MDWRRIIKYSAILLFAQVTIGTVITIVFGKPDLEQDTAVLRVLVEYVIDSVITIIILYNLAKHQIKHPYIHSMLTVLFSYIFSFIIVSFAVGLMAGIIQWILGIPLTAIEIVIATYLGVKSRTMKKEVQNTI